MKANKRQKVPPLPLEKALEMFKQHVGGETTTEAADNIPELVESAKACHLLSRLLASNHWKDESRGREACNILKNILLPINC